MPRMEEATADFSYVRLLGDRREFRSGHTQLKKERDDDLRWWADLTGRFLEEGKPSSSTRTTTTRTTRPRRWSGF
jgi:hypothetical protein